MRSIKFGVLMTLLAAPLAAQDNAPPEGWMVRLDRADRGESLQFQNMPPGFHLTTNRAAGVFYHPDRVASGEYKLSSTIYLFDPGERHRESYGLIFGGSDLQGSGQAYTYFIIRDTGEFLIKRRHGETTSDVMAWTATDAIMAYPGGDEQGKNTLGVVVGAETVDFYINDTKVASLPRSNVDTDGIVGVRANHGLNLHVTDVTVERM
jgi:hypothetical protein